MSKLFELVILLKCETFLETCPNQFGLRNATAQKCTSMF